MRPGHLTLLTALTASLALTGCSNGDAEVVRPPAAAAALPGTVTAGLVGPDGASLGEVSLSFEGDGTTLSVEATGLKPGAHGFHLHKTGKCEPKSPDPTDASKTGDFLSAGGHLAEEGQSHGSHTGDLPSLIAGPDGRAQLTTTLYGVPEDAVLDNDGTAVMVHAMPDNFGNVPDRYAPGGTDDTTKKTGDAGARIGCAPVLKG